MENKTESIHVRVNPNVKKESEEILDALGLNMSYAISLFTNQVIDKKKMPFEISLNSKEIPFEEEVAYAINLTGGKEVSPNFKKIIHLYAIGDIDYETAVFAINDSF